MNSYTRLSRFISLVLRHKPEVIDLDLDEYGWCSVDELIKKSSKKGLSYEILDIIVENDKKGRYQYSPDKKRIRANQGHSIDVKLDLEEIKPPDRLYHGTKASFYESILIEGLKKMKRHHVHLSEDIITAKQVGSRRGQAIILVIDTKQMYLDGYKFYRSRNGVWLTDQVEAKYIRRYDD